MTSTMLGRRNQLSASMAIKVPCVCATTGNITLSGLQTIDGVAVVADDRVLVKDQASSVNNGIYIADTGAWERASDANGSYDITDGTMVVITGGTTYGNMIMQQTSSGVVVGSTAMTWAVLISSTAVSISAYILGLLNDADAAAAQTTLGLVPGVNVQAYDADIATSVASSSDVVTGTSATNKTVSPFLLAFASQVHSGTTSRVVGANADLVAAGMAVTIYVRELAGTLVSTWHNSKQRSALYDLTALNLDLSTTGSGGMWASTSPTNGHVSIYALMDNAGTASLTALPASTVDVMKEFISSLGSSLYASKLVAIWPTDAAGNLVAGRLRDRQFWWETPQVLIYNSSAVVTTSFSSAAFGVGLGYAIPQNSISVSGILGSSLTGNTCIAISGSTLGAGQVQLTAISSNQNIDSFYACTPFSDLVMASPPVVYSKGYSTGNSIKVSLTSYRF